MEERYLRPKAQEVVHASQGRMLYVHKHLDLKIVTNRTNINLYGRHRASCTITYYITNSIRASVRSTDTDKKFIPLEPHTSNINSQNSSKLANLTR